ncbi:MAG: hypothetical protein V4513_02470 [Pseudomonadota bacterium]
MASKAGNTRNGIPWRIVGWGTAVVLLTLPAVLGAPWTIEDYVFASVMFGIVGGLIELAVRTSRNPWYRGGALIAVAASFLLVWINGAVGIIGDEGNPANFMFLAVILIALAGAIVARFRADGMARAMAVVAAAQALVGVVAGAYRLGASEPPGLLGVLILIGGFTGMWGVSALMFRKAAQAAA